MGLAHPHTRVFRTTLLDQWRNLRLCCLGWALQSMTFALMSKEGCMYGTDRWHGAKGLSRPWDWSSEIARYHTHASPLLQPTPAGLPRVAPGADTYRSALLGSGSWAHFPPSGPRASCWALPGRRRALPTPSPGGSCSSSGPPCKPEKEKAESGGVCEAGDCFMPDPIRDAWLFTHEGTPKAGRKTRFRDVSLFF